MKRPTRTKLYERRREVANYALKGWTQAAIIGVVKGSPFNGCTLFRRGA